MPIPVITSLAELEKVLVFGQPETVTLEFKEKVNGLTPKAPKEVRQEAQRETCRDFSQMANTRGGYVVYGVSEVKVATGMKVAGTWAPLSDPEEMKAWLEQALVNHCVPATFTKDIVPVRVPGGVVLVATIQPSIAAVYVWGGSDGTIQCLTRTSTGKRYMNPDELERHIMDGSRASRLAFEEALAAPGRRDDIVIADGIWAGGYPKPEYQLPGRIRLGRHDDRTFQLVIVNANGATGINLPYSLIGHVWLDVQSRLTLLLGARIVYEAGAFLMRPLT